MRVQIGEGEPNNQVEEDNPCSSTSAFEDSLKKIQLRPWKDQKQDVSHFLRGKTKSILSHLSNELAEKRGIKWFISVKVRFVKPKPNGESLATESHFRSLCMKTVGQQELHNQLEEVKQKITQSLVLFQKEGSGWVLDEILHLDLSIAQYTPVKGSSYIPLPSKINAKKAVINIKNSDNKCFMWSVLAALHPVKQSAERLHHYQQFQDELDLAGIEFPVTVDKIGKFERQNHISVNVFGFEDVLFPIYITKEHFDTHVNLLLYSQGTTRHYCLIKDLNKLLYSQNRRKTRMYYCRYCLHGFIRDNLLQEHEPHCSQHGPQRIELPNEDNAQLFFKDYHKQLKVPFAIYADFESLTTKINSVKPNPEKSSTEKYQHHQPCGFSYIVVSDHEKYSKPPVVYRGEDAVDKFLECLEEEQKYIQEKLDWVEPMRIEREEEQAFQDAVNCHICGFELGADRVRDHCHLTGKYRGAAHNVCNLNYSFNGRVPVILHNLRGYDSHLIMQGLGKLKDKKINCIPNNTEKYISFSIDNLDFIDSLQFMNASLEKLVSNLAKDGVDKFPTLKKYIDSDKTPLLLRKGVYPYDYVDCTERFEEPTLPPKESFYNVLNDEHISDEDYAHATNVFNKFACRNMGDYHDLYLTSDVLLLADVFKNFRSVCLKAYNLDPCHFYTSPGLAWQACLKMTEVELELLTDPDMYLFIEEGLRGGISMISNRYGKANNPYVPDYDPEQETSYVMYLDANNLYGWAMSQPLPTGEFDWLTDQEIAQFDITDVADDDDEGYILEVDLHYPSELHDLHNDYPLAPEKMKISSEMLSPYCQDLSECLQLRGGVVSKLVPNLRNKTNYVVHYRNLKQYLALGMKLAKIHRVLVFQQSPWLKTYIDFNTEKRKHAANDFEKDFYKLMNNSVFGKTMENLRKRVNVKLVNDKTKLSKLTASPSFDYFRIFSEDLAAVNMKKTKLYLNRPIYVGFTILDLSKVLMYQFHYEYMKPKYDCNAKLLFTDTDSLCYEIKTDDVYQDMLQDIDLFDTSEYARDHPLHSLTNKKVLGKMKDETHGIPIQEFVGLRPKMYSILYTENDKQVEKKTAKGIKKSVTKRKLRHINYKECLFDKKRTMASMNQIRSERHEIYSIKLNKIGLSPYDDKRYIIKDGVNTLAYGHYQIISTDE
ncbi:uncharacterized protein LOC114541307 [Dendronephthya gigantea]|uniref:uncharacterized protein LOC114541307 n=1 Tax=Dendronephthya gigantea TaxID=151771 RepID=UPI0010698F48|nr:uncharacterized protein LOC114541307 [Dendronephthya gigantea]